MQKGYGYADVESTRRSIRSCTLFRPGSVSKLFTWTAVMQLVEQGKLDLDADINKYLDFEIPDRDGKPITLRNIMTHTSGFEEQEQGLIAREQDGVARTGAYLKDGRRLGSLRPATTPAYSNCGHCARRLHRRSGFQVSTFDDYLDKHIFAAARHAALDLPPAAARSS